MRFTLKRIEALIEEALKEEPTGDVWLDKRYDEQFNLIGHSNPYYRLFYLLSQELKPKTIVELGGWQGTAAAHFAVAYPAAKVITIDHHSDPGDELNKMKMLEVVNRYPNVHYVQGWTSPGFAEEYPEKGAGCAFEDVKKILGDDKIDILFIDSWHEGRYLQRDWDYYSPLLSNPALVICDDVMDTELFINMVSAVNTLPGEKLFDARLHPPSIPMGFIKYASKRIAKARKPRKKRTTAKKAV